MTSYAWKIPLLLVREIRNLVREKSGNFIFFDVWKPCKIDIELFLLKERLNRESSYHMHSNSEF